MQLLGDVSVLAEQDPGVAQVMAISGVGGDLVRM